MNKTEVITRKHIDTMARELADAAQITPQQAQKVLEILHINKLNENVVAMRTILENESSVNALGLSHAEARSRLQELQPENFTLKVMRVAFKGPGAHILNNAV